MLRFNGMMPVNDIEKEETFKDSFGLNVIIQAGPLGWSIIYSDGSAKWKDENITTEENFNNAFKIAEVELGTLTLVEHETYNKVIPGEES